MVDGKRQEEEVVGVDESCGCCVVRELVPSSVMVNLGGIVGK